VPTVIFQAKAAQGATPGQIACNSFAAGGAVRHYLNSSTPQDVPVAPLESGNVCIAIDSTSRCYRATLVPPVVSVGQVQGGCKYTVTVTLSNPGTTPLSGVANSSAGDGIAVELYGPGGQLNADVELHRHPSAG
jgi:hypothetical protein